MAGLCLIKGQAAAMECLAQCMQQSWMCILVGPSGSGTHHSFSTTPQHPHTSVSLQNGMFPWRPGISSSYCCNCTPYQHNPKQIQPGLSI